MEEGSSREVNIFFAARERAFGTDSRPAAKSSGGWRGGAAGEGDGGRSSGRQRQRVKKALSFQKKACQRDRRPGRRQRGEPPRQCSASLLRAPVPPEPCDVTSRSGCRCSEPRPRLCSSYSFIKLPRLSGRLRLPFFRKSPSKPLQGGHNMETDLTSFLQNGAQPGMPTLHKLLLKQYGPPPMHGGPGSVPQASHPYPSSMAPFGMPRLPAPTSVRPIIHPPPPPPMYPMPPHLAGFHPMRPYYPRPGGMLPGMPFPSNPFAVLPPPPGPRPPPPPPPPPKMNKRPGPGPNVVFADKEPQSSGGNFDSAEFDDETPIIIRGRKPHGKRRRPIVIEEDVSSEEDDSRPIVVRGRKPYRTRGRRPSPMADQDEPEEYPNRKRPFTYIEELSESRPYDTRGGGGFEDEVPKPSGSFIHDVPTGPRSILRYPPGGSRFFQPDSSRFDSLMTSEQRNSPRATGTPSFFTGSSGGMIHDFSNLLSHQRHNDFSGLLDEPKMVLTPHIDGVTSLRDRHEQTNFFPNKLEAPPSSKTMPPIVFQFPNKAPPNQNKYVQALIVPIQGSIDQVAEETFDKATRGQSFVFLPAESRSLTRQAAEGTYERLSGTAEPFQTRRPCCRPVLLAGYVRETTQQFGSQRKPNATPISPGRRFTKLRATHCDSHSGNDQNRSKMVIIALPRNELTRGAQSVGSPNSRSSTIVNTYYQPSSLTKGPPGNSAEASTAVPMRYSEPRRNTQYVVPKVPYNVVSSPTSSQFDLSDSRHKSPSTSTGSSRKEGYSSTSSFFSSVDGSQQQSYLKIKHPASSSNYARRVPPSPAYYEQQPLSSSPNTPQRRATHVSQYARRKYSSGADSLLGPYDPGYDNYPSLTKLPDTSFTCYNRAPGYYASTEHKCQVYHHCTNSGSLQTFLCPNGTAFSQQTLVCEWWHGVTCQASRSTHPAKDSALQSIDVDYPVWPSGSPQRAQQPPPSSAPSHHPSTTRAPQPPSYSSSVSFSVAAANKTPTRSPYSGSRGGSTEYGLNLGGGEPQNTTLGFQRTGQKVVRTRKLVTKLRGSSGSQASSGETRRRSQGLSTTQSPDSKASAE
ncbi:hypothetical protein HPB48_011743 [Haemaphysalis longicornis]|uniref:Chitin-binding type-2 domain-containing protein n=1 Tax=Haemaphysalis longicornis TaxID=44386 RepID=A0A9J6H1Y2_HAELO|nr:hypothetical protein HPB48_011743 [Haemaphysalis longicornis]